MNGLSLCAGIGTLDIAVEIAFPRYRCIAAIEKDPQAARRFRRRFPQAKVFRDVLGFDGRPFDGVVDAVVAGWPCQPHSVAGRRRGVNDERWIWSDIARVLDECGAPYFFGENVSGILKDADSPADEPLDVDDAADDAVGGMGAVLRDLAALGFDVEWGSLRASDVGASHGRLRTFFVAVRVADAADDGRRQQARRGDGRAEGNGCGWNQADGGPLQPSGILAAAEYARCGGDGAAHDDDGRDAFRHYADGCDPAVADASVERFARSERAEPPGAQRQPEGRTVAQLHRAPLAHTEHARLARAGTSSRPSAETTLHRGSGGAVADAGSQQPEIREGSDGVNEQRSEVGRRELFAAGAGASSGARLRSDAGRDDRHRASARDQADPRVELPLFAPGPNDPRWPAILQARPDLAPALSPVTKLLADSLREGWPIHRWEVEEESALSEEALARILRMANGVARWLEQRRPRLQCAGNGVVPIQCAAVLVELAHRLGIAEQLGCFYQSQTPNDTADRAAR